jgi:single-strand DNA-binding protein
MAGSYNRITLVGNLTRDPEIRYVDGGGKAVTKFSLAINRKTKGNDETMYIDIVAWDRLGEICNQYLKKGMSTLVEGRLSIRDYTNKDGEKRKAVEVVASDMQMLDSKRNSEGGGSYNGGASRPAAAVGAAAPADDGFGGDAMEDEIPF